MDFCSPANAEELFNLRHASLRNVIERIFGVVKRRFRILVHPPEFDMDIQARTPAALAAIHNFIRVHDPEDLADYDDTYDLQPGQRVERVAATGQLSSGLTGRVEREQAGLERDKMAERMWTQYQQELKRRRHVV